eukprot:366348-Amphidinium_carterae.1
MDRMYPKAILAIAVVIDKRASNTNLIGLSYTSRRSGDVLIVALNMSLKKYKSTSILLAEYMKAMMIPMTQHGAQAPAAVGQAAH